MKAKYIKESVILFGSAISIWEPSGIPNGQVVSSALLTFLLQKSVLEHWKKMGIEKWLYNIPFEQINDCCPIELYEFYSKLFKVSLPNLLHKELARCAESKNICGLLTTNYDCGVEISLSANSIVQPICQPEEYDLTRVPLFKIHGSIKKPHTLVYRLSQESTLPFEKKTLLNEIVSGRSLIIIGYSGIDFEICPSLIKAEPKEITWFVKPGEEDTPGYQTIKESHIPMRRVEWDLLYGLPWCPLDKPLTPKKMFLEDIVRSIDKNFNREKDKYLWSLRFTNRIGYPKLSEKIIKSLAKKNDVQILYEKAVSNFNMGKYKDSGKAYELLFIKYINSKDYLNAARSTLHESEAWWCQGKFLRCFYSLIRAYRIAHKKFPVNHQLHKEIGLKFFRFLIVIDEIIFSLLRLRNHFIRKIAIKILPEIMESLAKEGDMHGVFAAKDFYLEFKNNTTNIDGYKHLGSLINLCRCVRRNVSEKPDTYELKRNYRLMVKLGCYPEAWKNASMLEVLLSKQKQYWKRRKKIYRSKCQYTFLGKYLYQYLINKRLNLRFVAS